MTRLFTNATAAWAVPLIIALVSLILSGATAYSHNDKVLSNRITALESHHEDDSQRLGHIESQVDRLVEWALGTKK